MTDISVRTWVTSHPTATDVAIAAAVATVPLLVEATDALDVGASLDGIDVATSALAFVLISVRRLAPLPVMAIALVAAVVAQLPDPDYIVLQVAVCLVLYTVASTCDRVVAWSVGIVAGATLFAAATLTTVGPWYDGENLEVIAWAAVATAAGDAVRSRRSYVTAREERAAALRDRAERAEQALEQEARRQVIEERLRIARELHDVVAHHIAVINVQAGVAAHLVHDDPDGAEQALTHVRRGAHSVLAELGGILDVMRSDDTVDTIEATDPLPTLEQLERLIEGFRAVGLDVEWHTAGTRRPVSPTVGLAGYRIIQEALTNAHRHGSGGDVELSVDYRRDSLDIEVVNACRVPSDDSTPSDARAGHGIIGMRERVAAAGGAIETGPTSEGTFRVFVSLPSTEEQR